MDAADLAYRLTAWIRECVGEAGLCGVVSGLSGGLDSSVVAVLNRMAFPEASLSLLMPCHSDPTDVEHAMLVTETFGLDTRQVVLDEIYDKLVSTLGEVGAEERRGLALANLKPRLRMITLYYFGNWLDRMVVGTGNRSELTVGYFTKYGDGGADILPLGGVVKAQVRELAAHLGIPKEIIEKPPTAGLWAGQTDEQEMGVSYEELDRYILTGEAPEPVKKRIEQLSAAGIHKRATPLVPPF